MKTTIIKKIFTASFGLFMFGFGVYMTIQANIGVGPWDTLDLGISGTIGISYGTASIIVSLIIVAIDIMMKEKIGIGMILDAFIVGKTVDLFNWIGLIDYQVNTGKGIFLMITGLIIMGFSQYIYMIVGLGCGPRDTMLVGLSRKMTKVPIGIISVVIMAVVTFSGWILGAPIGLGTLICAFLTGPIMEATFKFVKFIPTDVEHQTITDTIRILYNKDHSQR